MLVKLKDGKCRSCGGQLKITDVDDSIMNVECQSPECSDAYPVEADAFNDGGIHYWPHMMAAQQEADANSELSESE